MDGVIPPTRSTIPGGRLESPCRLCWALKNQLPRQNWSKKKVAIFHCNQYSYLLQDDGSAQIHPHHAMTITGKTPGTLSSSTLEISDSSLILLTQSAMTRVKQIHMHQLPEQYVLNVFGWHKTPRIKITRNTKVDRHMQCKDSSTYR